MRKFSCPSCNARLYFENVTCETCGEAVAFSPVSLRLEKLHRPCANRTFGTCNWCVTESWTRFCIACELNRTIPDLSVTDNLRRWRRIEAAKHRLVYDLLRLRLPVLSRTKYAGGLVFDFLTAVTAPVLMSHADGVVTIDIAEADDATREFHRARLYEPYRTLLGHFRHEIGHYFWDRLVRDGPHLATCRSVFGDERMDYNQAVQRHYWTGPPNNWSQNYISAYASSHPWEDWAETFAHLLLILSTLDTAASLPLAPEGFTLQNITDVYEEPDFQTLVKSWLPLAESLNELNRSMGITDPYPFVLGDRVIGKLQAVLMILRSAGNHV